jgi:hypothetical protein
MQQTQRKNQISNLGEYSYKSQYLNLQKIHDFIESIENVQVAANVIASNEQTINRLYRWLEREERRLQRDAAKRINIEQ